MFSVIFPGQGSQIIGMGQEFYTKYQSIKDLFQEANDILSFDISKMIMEGPKSELDLTINTQPAIFLVSYSIFQTIKNEYNINLNNGKFFAGHSLGEYSALCCAGYLKFSDTLKTLRLRGQAMQNSVPEGVGGMVAILGTTIENIENIINENKKVFSVQIANDNSNGQMVLSGNLNDLDKLISVLKEKGIKNIKLPVSAPFHCSLMNNATEVMRNHLDNLKFTSGINTLVSNVTANEVSEHGKIKDLLVQQIENRVRWRESVIYMIEKKVNQFIEIGPGKVLSGLIKRINKEVKMVSINSEDDIESLVI